MRGLPIAVSICGAALIGLLVGIWIGYSAFHGTQPPLLAAANAVASGGALPDGGGDARPAAAEDDSGSAEPGRRVAGGIAGSRPRIAVIASTSWKGQNSLVGALRDGLRRLGYIEGQTVDIDYSYADGERLQLSTLVEDLVALKPDVIVADTPSAALAVKAIAPDLPMVCPGLTAATIPQLASSYARPGGSVTGIATSVEGSFSKIVELTFAAIPGAARIGVLTNPDGPSMAYYEEQARSSVRANRAELSVQTAASRSEFSDAFGRLSREKLDAIIVPPNALFNSEPESIAELAIASRLPAVFSDRRGAEAGGLASYGVDYRENFRRAALYVDRILKGAAPANMPIEFLSKFELIINLRTAKALGLTVPPALLARADEVIE